MFDSPAVLLSSLIIGLAGMGLLIYGKKQSNFKCLAAGAGLCVYPYFVHSLIVMWAVALVCGAGLWLARGE